MATGLERRLRVLEDTGGGGECPRCSGLVATFVNGEFDSASRHGGQMSEEEYLAYEGENGPDSEYPVCGERPIVVKSGSPGPAPLPLLDGGLAS